MSITLTEKQAEALRFVLGDILDGRGGFDGTTLFEIEPVYEDLCVKPETERE